jgi:predicted transcriptional regulator
MNTDNPLGRWLDDHDESIVAFALRAKMSQSNLYGIIPGRVDPRISTLRTIEFCTAGEVTINQLIEWKISQESNT